MRVKKKRLETKVKQFNFMRGDYEYYTKNIIPNKYLEFLYFNINYISSIEEKVKKRKES